MIAILIAKVQSGDNKRPEYKDMKSGDLLKMGTLVISLWTFQHSPSLACSIETEIRSWVERFLISVCFQPFTHFLIIPFISITFRAANSPSSIRLRKQRHLIRRHLFQKYISQQGRGDITKAARAARMLAI